MKTTTKQLDLGLIAWKLRLYAGQIDCVANAYGDGLLDHDVLSLKKLADDIDAAIPESERIKGTGVL